MTEKDYMNVMANAYHTLESLPDHDREAIRIAAEQLSGMNADLSLGRLEIHASTLAKSDVKRQLQEIEELSFDELGSSINIEKPYDGSMTEEAWSRYAKAGRAELLLKRFTLLSRLRSDEPEAWDEVNELFFDD
ncbi:hypothetical protein [Spirochaeta isovalerica]|uniref:Uncharacterized protein n=1 Tax=Spirochaeta isovalerica TaxID=150 RepID=A0A841R7I4_9SPIO|nr:hypothetical protein [Spirochaeta isovalerica]MBB6479815.1 hypothetical protein [Spirochaeta isovalerica]